MFHSRFNLLASACQDDWADVPASGFFAKYAGGVIFPLVCVGYGVWCIVSHHGILFGNHTSIDVHGSRATALGIAAVSLGLFLHCHYFWGNIYQLGAVAAAGKIAGLMGIIAGLGYLIVQIGIWGNA
jgi:hypothetical protein